MNRPEPIEFFAFMFRIGFLERSRDRTQPLKHNCETKKKCDTILKIVSFIVTIKLSRDLYMKFHVQRRLGNIWSSNNSDIKRLI